MHVPLVGIVEPGLLTDMYWGLTYGFPLYKT